MTITLDVPGDVARQLTHKAGLLGLSLDQFVLRAALGHLDPSPQNESSFGIASHDPYLASASLRAVSAAQELQALGITDNQGRRLKAGLPEDMLEEADRDLGG